MLSPRSVPPIAVKGRCAAESVERKPTPQSVPFVREILLEPLDSSNRQSEATVRRKTHCTALEELEICLLKWVRNYNNRLLAPLTQLETFRLSLDPDPRIALTIPGRLIAAFVPKLKRIDLEKCHLSDEQFEALIYSGKLYDLEMMRLSHVCCLTIQSLRGLMARRSPFRFLHIYACPCITNEDIDILRWIVRVLNLDVVILSDYLEFTTV